MKYFKLPLKWNSITNYYSSSHLGVDFGWNNNYGGKNVNIYSLADGIVIDNAYNDQTGYRILIQTDDENNRWLHRYLHLNKKSSLTIGSKVKRGDLIGIMGNTGDSNGNHLHLDLWKCPKNYKYNFSDRKKYSVNPIDYCYLFDDQLMGANNKGIIKVIGTSNKVVKNLSNNQVEVIKPKLRIRKEAGLDKEILGYIDLGIYNYLNKIEKDGYLWYDLGFGYIASVNDYLIEYLFQEQVENDTNALDCSKLKKFIADKDGIYYINLKKGNKIYY